MDCSDIVKATVDLPLDQVLDVLDQYSRTRLDLYRNIVMEYCWSTTMSSDKYESLYLVAGLRYLIPMYIHTPCNVFKSKYPALCIAYGLETMDTYVEEFDYDDFTTLLKSQDLHTIRHFAKILITRNAMDWNRLAQDVGYGFDKDDVATWVRDARKHSSNTTDAADAKGYGYVTKTKVIKRFSTKYYRVKCSK